MRKIFAICLMLVCAAFGLTGCGEKTAQVDILPCQEIVTAVQDSQEFTTEMKAMEREQLLRYLAIESDQLADGAMSMDASRETPEAIVVLTASAQDHVKPLQGALSLYLQDMMEQYRDYRPLEMPKLENAVLRTHGTQVVLVIGPDADATNKTLDEKMGK